MHAYCATKLIFIYCYILFKYTFLRNGIFLVYFRPTLGTTRNEYEVLFFRKSKKITVCQIDTRKNYVSIFIYCKIIDK